LLREGLENGNFCDVILMTHLGDFEVFLYHSQFLRPYEPNHATHGSPRHKKDQNYPIVYLFSYL